MTDAKLIAQLRSVHAAAYYCDLAVDRIEALTAKVKRFYKWGG